MEEAEELLALIAAVCASEGASAGAAYPRYKSIVTKYQEQPQLLDGCLEGVVQPLAALLRSTAISSSGADTRAVQDVCRLLHVLICVRGYKTVVRFFPHEAADLERVLQVLGALAEASAAARDASSSSGAGSDGVRLALWEAQAVLLLWLSILVLLPMDLAILDSAVTCEASRAAAAAAGFTPLAGRIMALCQAYLAHPGAVREMAALLLARLLTRPDMAPALRAWMPWQAQALADAGTGPASIFLLPGVLQTLALVFKVGRRQQLLPLAPEVWRQVSSLLGDADGGCSSSSNAAMAGNSLARELAVKLAQRVGLVLLPPRLPAWRHVAAAADLRSNLGGVAQQRQVQQQPQMLLLGQQPAAAGSAVICQDASSTAQQQQQQQQQQQDGEDEQPSDAFEVPAELEDVLGLLLSSCADRDTIVRWSAAKGVGRLAGRLPLELAEEVVDGVMGLLAPSEPDTAWHGGCLAIAELARRGALPPGRLPAVARLLMAALAYDVRRGPHSVGAHVRDAAAYVCWALARAYSPAQLAGATAGLGACLLVVACYDREVNVRRAAASAFQEAVGRLGQGFCPYGLQALALADYYTVGGAARAYLRVAPAVGCLDAGLAASLAGHLAGVKLRHWEPAMRRLAACGLAALAAVPGAAPQLAGGALPALLASAEDAALEVRAGAVLGAAELLPALAAAGLGALPADVAAAVTGLLPRLRAAGLYRGRGGEAMRAAAARFVEQAAAAAGGLPVVSLVTASSSSDKGQTCGSSGGGNSPVEAASDDGDAGSDADDGECGGKPAAAVVASQQQQQQHLQLPLDDGFHEAAVALLQDCLGHAQVSIQAAGTSALAAYVRAFQHEQPQRARLLALVQASCSALSSGDALAATRRGAAAALGVMPAGLLGDVLDVLAAAAQAPLNPQAGRDIEVRIAAVNALPSVVAELITAAQAAAQPQQPGMQRSSSDADADVAAEAAGVPVDAIAGAVCPVLLGALEDYTRDERGDVGSWVRQAAIDGLTQLVLLLGSTAAQLPEEQQQQQQGADAAAFLAQGVAALCLPRQQEPAAGWEQTQQQLAQLHARLAPLAVAGLLRQSLERIARLREAAVTHLRCLLQQPATAAAVPGASQLLVALPSDAAELAGVASLAGVSRLAALLQLPWYRLPLLEGLAAGIGGVDASLAKASAAALLAQLGSGSGGGEGTQELRADVARLLVQLWQQQAGSARMALPLVKTAALLITHADFAAVQVPGLPAASDSTTSSSMRPEPSAQPSSDASSSSGASTLAACVLQLLRQEVRGCSDVPKLLEAAALMAQLACVPDCSAAAVQSVMVLLVNRFPKVRRNTAEQLYLQLLALQAECDDNDDDGGDGASSMAAASPGGRTVFAGLPADELEAAADVLLVSAWDGPLEQVRAAREQLAQHLRLEIRTRQVAAAGAAARTSAGVAAAGAGPAGAAAHESYQSLLDDAARGGGY